MLEKIYKYLLRRIYEVYNKGSNAESKYEHHLGEMRQKEDDEENAFVKVHYSWNQKNKWISEKLKILAN